MKLFSCVEEDVMDFILSKYILLYESSILVLFWDEAFVVRVSVSFVPCQPLLSVCLESGDQHVDDSFEGVGESEVPVFSSGAYEFCVEASPCQE